MYIYTALFSSAQRKREVLRCNKLHWVCVSMRARSSWRPALISGFCSMKWPRGFLLNGMLVHRKIISSIKFFGTYSYTWVKEGTLSKVSCPRAHHNVLSRTRTRTANHEVIAPPLHWPCAFVWFNSLRTVNLTYLSKMSDHLQHIHSHTHTWKNQLCWCTRLARDTPCYYLSIHQYLICKITRSLSLKYLSSFNYRAIRKNLVTDFPSLLLSVRQAELDT